MFVTKLVKNNSKFNVLKKKFYFSDHSYCTYLNIKGGVAELVKRLLSTPKVQS